MVLSFIIVPVVSSFTQKPENVEETFKCYTQKVVVTSDMALTEEVESKDVESITEAKNDLKEIEEQE